MKAQAPRRRASAAGARHPVGGRSASFFWCWRAPSFPSLPPSPSRFTPFPCCWVAPPPRWPSSASGPSPAAGGPFPWPCWPPPGSWRCGGCGRPLALGAEALRVDVVNTVSASLELGFTLEPALSLPEALWTNCATLLVLLALVPLGALLGLGVVRLRSFWLVFVSSFPFVLLPLCISVTPGWAPLMALVLGWVVSALTSLLARTSPLGAARLNLAALPAAALLLAALSLAMPMDTYQRPAWADRALQHLTNQAVRLGTACWKGAAPSALATAGTAGRRRRLRLSPTRGRRASPDAPCWRWRPTSLAASTCGGSPTRYMTARAGSRWMRRPTTGRPASAASHMERPSRWTWTLASLGLSPCSPSSSP
ncbi:MAG: hypothetical protein ACLRNQ_15050 [Flavonifractor plautii]